MLQSRLHSDLALGSIPKEWKSVTQEKEYQAGFAVVFLFDLRASLRNLTVLLFLRLFSWSDSSGGRRLSRGCKLPLYSQLQGVAGMCILVSS